MPGPNRHTVYPKRFAIGGASVAVTVGVGGKSVGVSVKEGTAVSVRVGGINVAVFVGVVVEGLNVSGVAEVAVGKF